MTTVFLESGFWKAPIKRQALEAARVALNQEWGCNLWKVEGDTILVAGPARLGVSIYNGNGQGSTSHAGPMDIYVQNVLKLQSTIENLKEQVRSARMQAAGL